MIRISKMGTFVIALHRMWKCTIFNPKYHRYKWKQVITHVNSKLPEKRIQGDRWNIYKDKQNEDFAVDTELAFEMVRLRLVYSDDLQEFDRSPRCTFTNCPYGARNKEKIVGNFPKTQ